MAHADYDCCAVCDSKLAYRAAAETKEYVCASCAIALMKRGVEVATPTEFMAWLKRVPADESRPILVAVGFTQCYYRNALDDFVTKLHGAEIGARQ